MWYKTMRNEIGLIAHFLGGFTLEICIASEYKYFIKYLLQGNICKTMSFVPSRIHIFGVGSTPSHKLGYYLEGTF